MILTKRVYDKREKNDGFRILVDRLWPRGLSKEKAKIDLWLKNIAPSNELRKWFSHDSKKWNEFKKGYFNELKNKDKDIELIQNKSKKGTITLLYGAKDSKFNNAIALKEYIEKK